MKTLEDLDGISLVTYDVKVIRYLEGSTELIVEDSFGFLLLGARLGSVVGILIGFMKDPVLGLRDGKVLGRTLGVFVGL